jgi:hypothetical protein
MNPEPLNKHKHLLLLGSPCHFVGELASNYFRLRLAWPRPRKQAFSMDPESPLFQSFVVIEFETPPDPEERKPFYVLPNFSYVADFFCVCLSAFFGKQFQNYGFLQTNGHFCIPGLAEIEPCIERNVRFLDRKPRKDRKRYRGCGLCGAA